VKHVEAPSAAVVAPVPYLYEFGPFQLDPIRGILTFHGETIALPWRILQLLLLIISANGEIVTKDTLAAAIWHHDRSAGANLSQHIYLLRQLLGERARDRAYVMTVHGKGYRFTVPVSVIPLQTRPSRDEPRSRELLLRPSLDAFVRFGNGRYQLERSDADSIRRAIGYFEAALSVDDTYAPALVWLARSYADLAEHWYAPPSCTYPKAKAAIARALTIEPSSADAHAVVSHIALVCDWDWKTAQREMHVALDANPGSIYAHINAAYYHACAGEREAALNQAQRALLLNPSSPSLQVFLGRILLQTGDYERATEYFTHLIESGEEFAFARGHRAAALICAGRSEEAIVELALVPANQTEDVTLRMPLLARAYAECGDLTRAGKIYDSLCEISAREYVANWNLAIAAASIGQTGTAIDLLEKARNERESAMLSLQNSPWFHSIHADPRFTDLLQATHGTPAGR
jgi:DNA-binding winged helix-turn-helix (wHTH) protein/Flp pilus assembly protein TadD